MRERKLFEVIKPLVETKAVLVAKLPNIILVQLKQEDNEVEEEVSEHEVSIEEKKEEIEETKDRYVRVKNENGYSFTVNEDEITVHNVKEIPYFLTREYVLKQMETFIQ